MGFGAVRAGRLVLFIFAVFLFGEVACAQAVFDITNYGAKPNSSESATDAFARAIAAAKAAGGGTVYVPAGHRGSHPL